MSVTRQCVRMIGYLDTGLLVCYGLMAMIYGGSGMTFVVTMLFIMFGSVNLVLATNERGRKEAYGTAKCWIWTNFCVIILCTLVFIKRLLPWALMIVVVRMAFLIMVCAFLRELGESEEARDGQPHAEQVVDLGIPNSGEQRPQDDSEESTDNATDREASTGRGFRGSRCRSRSLESLPPSYADLQSMKSGFPVFRRAETPPPSYAEVCEKK